MDEERLVWNVFLDMWLTEEEILELNNAGKNGRRESEECKG